MTAHRLNADFARHANDFAEIADPGDGGRITANEGIQVCNMVSAGAETRLLSDPTHQLQQLTLVMKTDGGDIVITADSGVNASGHTAITFNDAGDTLFLQGIKMADGTFEWRISGNQGVGTA